MKNIFDDPRYWCGDIGYRPDRSGIGYRDFAEINRIKARYILSKKPQKVLDVGCAMGYLVKRLRDYGVDAYGIDISRYAISHAPDDVKPYLVMGSADNLPCHDKEFDMVISFATFEHLSEKVLRKAIKECIRVAQRGIIAVGPSDIPHFDDDVTHKIKKPLSWWKEQFPPEFEVRSDADEEWLKTIPDVSKLPAVEIPRSIWVLKKLKADDTILEVGCADNPIFRDTLLKVVTLDYQVNPKLHIFPDVRANAMSLPFKDQSFDVVVCSELLEHVIEPQRVLMEARRVARKKIIVTVPLEYLWADENKPFSNPGHLRFYTPELFNMELNSLGLPYTVELIRNGSWVWLGAEVSNMLKLNLGSFVDTVGYNWVNIDILPVAQYIRKDHIFRQWDLRRGIPYPDNSIDLIRASHLIEHLTLEEAHNFCKELYRVLKLGGLVRILTPDARIIIRHYLSNDMAFFNEIQPPEYIAAPTQGEKLSRILFSGDYAHRAVYDYEMLKSFLEQAGFREIYKASPGSSHSRIMQEEAKDAHEAISLIVEAIK